MKTESTHEEALDEGLRVRKQVPGADRADRSMANVSGSS